YDEPEPPIHAVLDRRSLRAIADAGGGSYFELGSELDEAIALRIVRDARQSARGVLQREETFAELYWYCLAAAAALVALGTLVLRERTELWWQLAALGVLVALLL
ncbi:MAG: hypothetical protein OXH69_25385, partial [Acidobacteria bacterium]|nr:hypothetical protein [Acidobacteriota bacterium]